MNPQLNPKENQEKKDAELPLGSPPNGGASRYHEGERSEIGRADPDRYLFERGKVVLGKQAGGLIAKLKAAKGGDVGKAIAAIETAATRSDPREYVGAIIKQGGREREFSGKDAIV